MSQLLPGSFDSKYLNSAIAKWEEKVGIYGKRSTMLLPDDFTCSTLAELIGGPLKEHLVLNTTKLHYGGVREEIWCYMERRQNSDPVAMDVDAFVKGKRSKG